MSNIDMPAMSSSRYASNTMAIGGMGGLGVQGSNLGLNDYNNIALKYAELNQPTRMVAYQETPKMATSTRRIVKVFIADTNDNIPLDKQIIYKGEEKFTDMNDQELFFEIELASLLKAHNEERVKIADKAIKDRTEYLEPVRIRDLKMTVVTIASF